MALINLMGHTRASDPITAVMSLLPVPVQTVHMGYAATMGATFVHHQITDHSTSPPDYAEHYLEKFILMPYSPAATPRPGPEARPDPVLKPAPARP